MLPGRPRIHTRTRNTLARPSFRVPRAAVPLALFAACSPVSTRPAFAPFPEATAVVLDAPPLRVLGEVRSWLTDAGLRLDRASVEDRFVETAWYDTRTKQSESGRGEGLDERSTVKIRCWIDPDAPGKSKLTVEAVVRPLRDPSRTERDLEVIAPADHEGRKLVNRLLEAVKKKLGT